MKIDKASATPVVINETSSNTDVTQTKESNTASTKKSPHVTAQVQLLNLAKVFGLDGSLQPPDKQMPVEDRSVRKLRFSQLRRQQNMEKIIEKSIHYCAGDQVADRADPDWFDNFIELAERVSNSTMQELWAKILAGEISQPGSFSLKALQAFKNMSLHDAKLFGKACKLAVKDGGKKNIRIISGCYQQPGLFNILDKQREQHLALGQFGFSYGEVLTLADHHLLFAQETELYVGEQGETVNLRYNGVPLTLTARKKQCSLKFYKFTPIGAELAQLIGDKPDDKFLSHLKTQLSYHFSTDS